MKRRDTLKTALLSAGASILSWGGDIFAAPLVTELERVQSGKKPDMIITDIESFGVDLGIPEEELLSNYKLPGWKVGRYGVSKIITNSGIAGYCFGGGGSIQTAREMLIGKDPFAIEDFLTQGIGKIAGWEHALWDVMGKACGVPVFKLLGGPFRDKIKPYMTLVWPGGDRYRITEMDNMPYEKQAEDVFFLKKHGFLGVKIQAWRSNVMDDVEALKHIKRAVGADCEIMFDRTGDMAGWEWSFEDALKFCRGLEENGGYWIEEPFIKGDIAKSARLSEAVSILVTGGEFMQDYSMFAKYLANGAFDVVQPDCLGSGGILFCVKVALMAQAFKRQMILHGTHGLRLAGWLQVDAASPTTDWQEVVYARPNILPQEQWEPGLKLLHNKDALRVENGYMPIPQGPGLGLDVDEDAIKEYRVK